MIDLKIFKASNMKLDYFLLLTFIYNKDKRSINSLKTIPLFDFKDSELFLINNDYVLYIKEEYVVREKANKLFLGGVTIDFDKFFYNYPYKTPENRILRPENKEFRGKLVKEYLDAKKKYLNRVKTEEEDSVINNILLAKLQRCPRNELIYMKKLINYIEEEGWVKDVYYLNNNSTEPSLNKLVDG